MKRFWRRSSPLLFALLLGFGLASVADVGSLAATAKLHDLRSVDQLKDRFNDDTGVPRLVLLLSPT